MDTLPPRIQRFCMHLMRNSYTIKHTPGKSLISADTLSRLPLCNNVTHTDKDLMENTNIHVESVLEGLLTSNKHLSDLKEHLQSDSVCSQVMKYCAEGWPDRNHLQGVVKHCWPERAVLNVHSELPLRGTKLVIPANMRNSVLEKIHEGHWGWLNAENVLARQCGGQV